MSRKSSYVQTGRNSMLARMGGLTVLHALRASLGLMIVIHLVLVRHRRNRSNLRSEPSVKRVTAANNSGKNMRAEHK